MLGELWVAQPFSCCISHDFRRLSESPFKVHVEKLSLEGKTTGENQQLYLVPLEIKLKHSTVHMDEPCPLVTPNPGVAAIHDYASWATEASGNPEERDGEH